MIVDLEVIAKVEHDEVTAEATFVSVVEENERGSPVGNGKEDAVLLEENEGVAPYRGATVERRAEAALAARAISRGAVADIEVTALLIPLLHAAEAVRADRTRDLSHEALVRREVSVVGQTAALVKLQADDFDPAHHRSHGAAVRADRVATGACLALRQRHPPRNPRHITRRTIRVSHKVKARRGVHTSFKVSALVAALAIIAMTLTRSQMQRRNASSVSRPREQKQLQRPNRLSLPPHRRRQEWSQLSVSLGSLQCLRPCKAGTNGRTVSQDTRRVHYVTQHACSEDEERRLAHIVRLPSLFSP